jgi:hypothetical protein
MKGRYQMINFIEVAEDYKFCFPDLWDQLGSVGRAKKVAQIFIDSFVEDWEHFKKAQDANRRAEEAEKQIKIERRKKYHLRWKAGHPDFYLLLSDRSRMIVDIKTPVSEAVTMNNIILKAHRYYGDIVFEYCDGDHSKMEMGEFDNEICMREALFAAFGHRDKSCDWYDRVVRYWKKSEIY